MSVFTLHSNVLDDYRDFVRSFFTVADARARAFIERELVAEARLWPEALLQVSPSYARVASVDELADRGTILVETAQIFRTERGSPLDILELNERVEPADAAEEIYVGLDDLDSGSLHLRRWGKGSDLTGTKLRFRKGDIIFGRRRAYQRKLVGEEVV